MERVQCAHNFFYTMYVITFVRHRPSSLSSLKIYFRLWNVPLFSKWKNEKWMKTYTQCSAYKHKQTLNSHGADDGISGTAQYWQYEKNGVCIFRCACVLFPIVTKKKTESKTTEQKKKSFKQFLPIEMFILSILIFFFFFCCKSQEKIYQNTHEQIFGNVFHHFKIQSQILAI